MISESPKLSKYQLLSRLGSGGMAEVYLALVSGPSGFNKLQVLKVMRTDLEADEREDFLKMFEDEARLAARLNHPNIVQSHEVGFDEGQPFLAMEYLDGQSLFRIQKQACAAGKPLPLQMQVHVLCQVLEALEYAHALTDYDGTPLHIVHRDVSPQNVFVTYTGQTKLVDFGIAKTLQSNKTRAGVIKGKVAYMAPEQITGQALDGRTDVFSVGVILWEAIAGQPMHGESSVFQIMNRVVRGELLDIADVTPNAPRALRAILGRALAPAPTDRYESAAAFRQDLAAFLDELPRVRSRDVGEYVQRLFERERVAIGTVIRRAMAGELQVASSVGSYVGTRRLSSIGLLDGSQASVASARSDENASVSRPVSMRSWRDSWGLGLLVAALLVMATGVFFLWPRDHVGEAAVPQNSADIQVTMVPIEEPARARSSDVPDQPDHGPITPPEEDSSLPGRSADPTEASIPARDTTQSGYTPPEPWRLHRARPPKKAHQSLPSRKRRRRSQRVEKPKRASPETPATHPGKGTLSPFSGPGKKRPPVPALDRSDPWADPY